MLKHSFHSKLRSSHGKSTSLPKVALPEVSWWKRPDLIRLNLVIACLIQLSSANGYDGSLINGLQALPSWQSFMSNPKGTWLGFVVAVQPLGQIIGYFPCAWLVQRYGRKAGICVGYIWLLLGTILQAAAHNSATWIVGRAFMGLTTAFWFGSVPLLITEIAHPAYRGTCTALWNTGWFVGGLLAAWVTYGTARSEPESSWAWRTPALVQFALPVVSLVGLLMAPESPRWYVAQGRLDEARRMVITNHAAGKSEDEIVAFEISEITTALELERSASYAEMLRTPGNRHRLFITISLGTLSQWSGVGLAQYYLPSILESVNVTSATSQTLINGCLQIWNLITAISGALLVDIAGRHPLFALSNIMMLICFCLITGLSAGFAETGNNAAGVATIAFLFLYYGAYDLAYNPLQFAYTVEIWPYSLRSRGLAVGMVSTALAIFFNTFVNPIALGAIAWRYYFVYIAVLIIATIVCWLYYPETKGRTLEEIAVIFDGESAKVQPATVAEHEKA